MALNSLPVQSGDRLIRSLFTVFGSRAIRKLLFSLIGDPANFLFLPTIHPEHEPMAPR
jgi:hypothetical protein